MNYKSSEAEIEDTWLTDSLATFATTRDIHLREEIAHQTMWIAIRCAKRFGHRGEPYDDLLQVASLGLLKAIDRFEPCHSVHFVAYATPTIIGELRRYFRDNTWCLHVPRPIKDLQSSVNSAREELENSLARPAHASEIADHLHLPLDSVVWVLEANKVHHAYPLDSVHRNCTNNVNSVFDEVLDHEVISQMLTQLPSRQQKILFLHFFEELTQEEIATQIGLSQAHVGRLLAQTLQQLRVISKSDVSHVSTLTKTGTSFS